MDEITTADLRRWLDKLRGTKLAPNTQRGVLTAASAMLRYAAKQAYIPMSPTVGARPRRPPVDQPASANRATSTAAQLGALLDKLDDDYRPLGAMLAYAGLRVSEVLAVRWRDLDLDAGRLTVAAQLDRSRTHRASQDNGERRDRRPPPRPRPRAPRAPRPPSRSRHSPRAR